MGVGPLFDFKKNLWFKFFLFLFLKIFGKKQKTSGSIVGAIVFILFY
jgi:hypothetical protein